MGNDGSGKTTTSKQVFNFFKELGFDVLYKHEYEYAILRVAFKLLGKQNLKKSRDEMLIERKRSLKYIIWPILVWFDLLAQYCYYKVFRRNSIILLDRYPYDQYLSFRYLGTLTRFSEWLYLHFPKPDVNLVLVVEPEIAYERKKETHSYPLTFYKTQTEEYLQLANRLGIPTINTNDDLKKTLAKVILISLQNPSIQKKVLRKGIQNRVLVNSFKKYGLFDSGQFRTLLCKHDERRMKLEKSIMTMKKILKNSKANIYGIIKTIDDFDFIGNDIDILVSSSDFEGILNEVYQNGKQYGIDKIKYDKDKDAGKMDIYIQNGLKLDIHSYIGWGNVIYFTFEDLKHSIIGGTIYGIECNIVDDRTNACIIAAHIFEKGYLTLDEYLFLKRYFDLSFFTERFQNLSSELHSYLNELSVILANDPKECPIFISSGTFVKAYLELGKHSGQGFKMDLFLRDLSFVLFWKIRYAIKKKLPFEITLQ